MQSLSNYQDYRLKYPEQFPASLSRCRESKVKGHMTFDFKTFDFKTFDFKTCDLHIMV